MLNPAMASSHNNDASDDFSLFLRQLLNRSSSSPAPEIHAHIPLGLTGAPSSNPDHPVPDQTHESPNATLSYWTTAAAGAPVDSDSMTAGSAQLKSTDNDTDEYDCESEEGPEGGLLRCSSRSSSKRSRAAEVHNLSEKRRRSRINEKMKALQNLIPNSNKTDKASMLGEAIEYLKQLQLQVQMLSMRNGMILNPMCMPGCTGVLNPVQLSQLGLNIVDRGESMNPNIPTTLHSAQTPQCNPSTRPLSSIMNAEAPFTVESPMPSQLSPFHMLSSSQNVCRDDSPRTNAVEFETEASTSVSIPVSKFRSQPSCTKNEAQRVLQGTSTDPLRLLSSSLDGLYPRTTSSSGCLATMDQKANIF